MLGSIKAIRTTLATALRKPVTVQYPNERMHLPERSRANPVLLWDAETGEPVCIGCKLCERACPCECITVQMKDNPLHAEGKSTRRKIVDFYYLDYGRCMRCGICVEVCNFNAITMNNTWTGHEIAALDRKDLIRDVDQLLAQSKSGAIAPWRCE